jgi:membrane-associated phospholipid phosphatase
LRLLGVLLTFLALGFVALFSMLTATGMSLEAGFAKFVLLAFLLLAIAGYCHFRGHDWRLTDSATAFAFITISLLLCGLVSLTGLRLGLPLADPMLADSDRLVGFDVRSVTHFVAARPMLSAVLERAYNWSGILCVAAILWNLIKDDRMRMWHAVATIGIAMQITALVSIFFPARGATVHLGLDALQGQGLPFGAGTYSTQEFSHFYEGKDLLVLVSDMNGIVCFPSFHTVMALVIVQGFAQSRLKWLAVAWGALTIVSTIPMGGHYVTDLAGGVVVWAVSCLIGAWACGLRPGQSGFGGQLGSSLFAFLRPSVAGLRRSAGS